MTITIKIGSRPTPEYEPVKMELIARKTIDGNIVVYDHRDIDIVLVPGDKKIIAFPKKSMEDDIYHSQSRLFDFLSSKGVVDRSSVRSGDAYASLEATYPEAKEGNTTQLVLYSIGKWIEKEIPDMKTEEFVENEWEEELTNPDDEQSTEFGEIPHKEKKGTIDPSRTRRYMSGQGFY